jgi:hypothetical protein
MCRGSGEYVRKGCVSRAGVVEYGADGRCAEVVIEAGGRGGAQNLVKLDAGRGGGW